MGMGCGHSISKLMSVVINQQWPAKCQWNPDNITDVQWKPVHHMKHISAQPIMKFYHRKYMLQKKAILKT